MSEVIVEILTGKVRGLVQKGLEHDEFYAFKGIPYAKPPVGQLRFRDPEPAEPWVGVREATNYGPCCAQFDFVVYGQLMGDDDCLYLNVYTKDLKLQVGRPVIFWIHASLFLLGSGDDVLYGPDYFMRKDVVFVTFNHRLGVFGFLNLDDEEASGNQGLKDMVMALRWVRDNIANFGGDPNNVTIVGASAGSVSAHYLAVSPLAKGLFHKAIFQSGVILNPWAFFSNPKERAYQLCEYLGHSEKDPKSIVEFLRTVDAQQLAMAQEKLENYTDKIRCTHSFGPSIDAKSKDPFMPVHPEIAAAEAVQVPLIIGHTSREGLFYRKNLTMSFNRFDKEMDKILHPDLISTLKKLYHLSPEGLKHSYFKNNSITKNNLKTLFDMYGDVYYVEGIHRTLRTQVEKGCWPTYFYQFSYDKRLLSSRKSTDVEMSGVGHAVEIKYLFKMHSSIGVLGNVDNDYETRRMTERLIELWVNFATTGNPTPQTSDLIPVYWQPVDDKTLFKYLDIDKELRMDIMLNLEQRYIAHGDSAIEFQRQHARDFKKLSSAL